MTIQIGEWHLINVVLIPADEDGPAELDFDVIHTPMCKQTHDALDQAFMSYASWDCDLGVEITNDGYHGFGIVDPGTYLARFILSRDYWGEWDGEVEVEKLEDGS